MIAGPDVPTMGSLVTDGDGSATFRLPEGTFSVTADWLGVTVLEGEMAAEGDGTHTMTASIHYVDIALVDSRGLPMADARLVVTLPGVDGVLAVGTTATEGDVTLRLPLATYNVEVLWKDELCLVGSMDVEGDGPIGLVAWVHYLAFHAVDDGNVDLADADVRVTNSTTGVVLGTGVTASNGTIELRLPRGTFALDVAWMGVTVHEDGALAVEVDGAVAVNATVHYLTLKVRGADGGGVGKTTISATMGDRTFATGDTASDGSLVLRLPAGTYTVVMTLRTTYRLSNIDVSMSKDVDLNGSQTLRFDLDDTQYPIPVYKTSLFWVVLVIILLVLVILLLARGSIMRAGSDGLPGEDTKDEEGDLEVLLDDEKKVSLTDQVDEAEIDLEEG